jgi:hypothetical protein
MAKRFVVPTIAVMAVLVFPPLIRAQGLGNNPGAVYDSDVKGQKPGPAPRRSLAGIWEPAKGRAGGIQGKGAMAMESCARDKTTGKYAYRPDPPVTDTGYATPDCLKPEVEPPYTELGRKTLMAHKPVEGYRMVPDAVNNDPLLRCDPGGFPRLVLHNFRTSEIFQTPEQVAILYDFQKRWRAIWTDGRELPKDPEQPAWSVKNARPPESRWWGYSVGQWVDDYTFVAETNGFGDDDTWLDNAGLPHSDALEVQETYHRVDADHLELSIKITDSKMYTKTWVALDKLSLRLQSPHFDIEEMECSPSEQEHYYKYFGDQTGFAPGDTTK